MKRFFWMGLLLVVMMLALPLTSAVAAERDRSSDRGTDQQERDRDRDRGDRSPGRHDASEFGAGGILCITGLPEVHAMPSREGFRIVAQGEELSGVISGSSGWDALIGAGILVTIRNEVSNFNVSTGTFEGRLNAEITVITASGDRLSGQLQGSITGLFDPSLAEIDLLASIYASSVEGQWRLHDRSTQASGTANADFEPVDLDGDGVPDAFCGDLSLDGTVRL